MNLVLATSLRFHNAPYKINSWKADFFFLILKLFVRIPVTEGIYFFLIPFQLGCPESNCLHWMLLAGKHQQELEFLHFSLYIFMFLVLLWCLKSLHFLDRKGVVFASTALLVGAIISLFSYDFSPPIHMFLAMCFPSTRPTRLGEALEFSPSHWNLLQHCALSLQPQLCPDQGIGEVLPSKEPKACFLLCCSNFFFPLWFSRGRV